MDLRALPSGETKSHLHLLYLMRFLECFFQLELMFLYDLEHSLIVLRFFSQENDEEKLCSFLLLFLFLYSGFLA